MADEMPGLTHDELWAVCEERPQDHGAYGDGTRPWNPQCVEGCRWFHVLEGARGADWGVCGNPGSHRAGLLTFEHMGCSEFEYDERLDEWFDDWFGTPPDSENES